MEVVDSVLVAVVGPVQRGAAWGNNLVPRIADKVRLVMAPRPVAQLGTSGAAGLACWGGFHGSAGC